MEFLTKDYELYYQSYLKGNIFEDTIFKSFVFNDYILLLRRCRKYYQILQSSKCGFEALNYFRNFDLLYTNASLKDTEEMFLSYVVRLTEKINNELH